VSEKHQEKKMKLPFPLRQLYSFACSNLKSYNSERPEPPD